MPGMCMMNYEPICVANGAINIMDGDDFCVVGMHTEGLVSKNHVADNLVDLTLQVT